MHVLLPVRKTSLDAGEPEGAGGLALIARACPAVAEGICDRALGNPTNAIRAIVASATPPATHSGSENVSSLVVATSSAAIGS